MIKLQWANDFGGGEKNLIDLQPWQHIRLPEHRGVSSGLYVERMQVEHSFSDLSVTTVVVVVPSLDMRVEAEMRGDYVADFMFALWLAVEHRRTHGNYWARFMQDMRERGIYVELAYERTFVRPRWDTPTPPTHVIDAVGRILSGGSYL